MVIWRPPVSRPYTHVCSIHSIVFFICPEKFPPCDGTRKFPPSKFLSLSPLVYLFLGPPAPKFPPLSSPSLFLPSPFLLNSPFVAPPAQISPSWRLRRQKIPSFPPAPKFPPFSRRICRIVAHMKKLWATKRRTHIPPRTPFHWSHQTFFIKTLHKILYVFTLFYDFQNRL